MKTLCYIAFLTFTAAAVSRESAQRKAEDLLNEFCLTKEELFVVKERSNAQLNQELLKEEEFKEFDLRISKDSHIERHRRFTFSSNASVARGIDNRLNVITMEQSRAIVLENRLPTDDFDRIVKVGFGPQVFCGDNCTCDVNTPYRTADGSCNNLVHTHWGQASTPFRRWLDPVYEDAISSPRKHVSGGGAPLPSAREVSYKVHELSTDADLSADFTHMLMQWGQFLDHDITSTPTQQGQYTGGSIQCCGLTPAQLATRPQCFPIVIDPANDPHFNKTDCMNFVRSVQVENADCLVSPVEQLNQITAYIDASNVYGSSQAEQNQLRTNINGLMKVKTLSGKEYLPQDSPDTCDTNSPVPDYCFKAGDKRVNENPTLQSMHSLFLWEHNRIAKKLKKLNCHWDDEKIFQETRKIVGALMQKITYGEYLPIVLGAGGMNFHDLDLLTSGFSSDYSTIIDAGIRNAFATAAFRYGHSMIRSFFSSLTAAYTGMGSDQLRTIYGNTNKILSDPNRDIDSYHRGLVQDKVQKVDGKLSPEVTRHLFTDGTDAFDLAALNIQRGRDHGLDTYMNYRNYCGKPVVTTFAGLSDTHDGAAIALLDSVYGSPADIDLFTGALTETPLAGSLVGHTLSCLLGQQFNVLKRGDRFWFEENQPKVAFTAAQLAELRKGSLSRVICDNTNTNNIQPNAFKLEPRVSCSSLPEINLAAWKDPLTMGTWGPWGPWGFCDKNGIRLRTRECEPCNCGCEGVNVQYEKCLTVAVEPLCTWTPWGKWGYCSKGSQRRTRTCSSSQSEGRNCYISLDPVMQKFSAVGN